jgi:acetoin utilization protein AcuB
MKVKQLIDAGDVITIQTSASCHDAIESMARNGVRHLPVVASDGTLAGMITDRDIRHHLFRPEVFHDLGAVDVKSLLSGVAVSQIMSSPVLTTTRDTDITDAASVMRRSRVGSLLVVEGTRPVGMLTETNLLREIVRADGACCPEVVTIVVSFP